MLLIKKNHFKLLFKILLILNLFFIYSFFKTLFFYNIGIINFFNFKTAVLFILILYITFNSIFYYIRFNAGVLTPFKLNKLNGIGYKNVTAIVKVFKKIVNNLNIGKFKYMLITIRFLNIRVIKAYINIGIVTLFINFKVFIIFK